MAYFIFIAFGFVLAGCSWLKPRSAPYCGAIFFIYAVLFAGMRGASMDYDNYVSMYQDMTRASGGLWQRLHIGKDPLFGALIMLIQVLGLSSQWLFMVSAFVGLAFKAKSFQRVFGSIMTPLFALVCGSYFLHDYTQVRVAIALGFSFMALVELCEGRKSRWMVYSVIALGFHVSTFAIVAFELPLVFGVRYNLWMVVASLFALLCVAYIGNLLAIIANFDGRAANYEELGNVSDHMMIVAPVKLVGLGILTFLLVKGSVEEAKVRILKLSCLFAFVGYGFLMIFKDNASGFGFRIYELFDAFSVFIIADALLGRKLISWGIALGYCAGLLLLLMDSKLLLPYEFADMGLW
ncbi:EpsG family protein [Dyella flava]|uniref:EpsG family protein n=1 Tax=Dyella flava TaxID=1920170 RepID=A0ABS2JZS7_9GAMM|nr:EpsG family protein [Dyella flava]MBM7123988.1 EpsG family protein [Dyella flava]GLQ50566.1 hypothetical protein GCM10010872_20150 [Dyella flava]